MRKLLTLAFVASVVLPSVAFAKGSHTMAGCGLGYVLFGHSDNSRLMQIFAATTNGTSANQTFGITSGTSGCTEDGAVKFAKEAEVYAEVNLDSLRADVAVGDGQFVRTFAKLLGASDKNVGSLVTVLHSEYASVFPSASVSTEGILENLQKVLSQHKDLLS